MFSKNSLRMALFALTIYMGNIAAAQDSTPTTIPSATLPLVSNERLGTGVPSRLPKVEVQRPVFTIQSGGPVAVPKPQFRPLRETNTSSAASNETKSTLPMIEQTRPWQKSGNEIPPPTEHQLQSITQTRATTPYSGQTRIRPVMPALLKYPPHSTAELPAAERKIIPAPAPQKPLPRPAALPVSGSENPARVLNFSIK